MHPWIFNIGVLLEGVLALPGAVGIYGTLSRGGSRVVALLCAIALAATGVMAIRAGLFPLPDPRHASWDFLIVLPMGGPALLLLAVWLQRGPVVLRLYLGACVVLLVLVLAHLIELAPGSRQRLLALATILPYGVIGAHALWVRRWSGRG
jgi:hypothetical membrane protein